jgi:hypothetical protein
MGLRQQHWDRTGGLANEGVKNFNDAGHGSICISGRLRAAIYTIIL